VLVVDDEASLLLTLEANLDMAGLQVCTAANAKQALELLNQQSFDLVLSDIRMPGISGVELFRLARQLQPATPVVLMTAYTIEALIDEAIEAGAFTVLSKPFDPEEALAVVQRAVRRPSVLIADPDRHLAEGTAASLKAMGVSVRTALDPAAALEAVANGTIDVCVVDLRLALDGEPPSLVTRLVAQERGLAVIGLSADRAPDLARKAASSGISTWLTKRTPSRAPDASRSAADRTDHAGALDEDLGGARLTTAAAVALSAGRAGRAA
jgi:DNA-binding NtrC family response regulator